MKKILFVQLFLLFVLLSGAQNYQAVNSGRISYFQYQNEIRALRVDSVSFDVDSILCFMPQIRNVEYDCYTPDGASWAGEKVIIKPTGEHIFFNQKSDSLLIDVNASLGEMWTVLNIPDSLKIIAEVTEHDTLSFLDVTDSVKTIEFMAYDYEDNVLDLNVNDIIMKISKNYGAVKTPHFYRFALTEDNFYDDIDYTSGIDFDLCGVTNPEMGYRNIIDKDIFDFQPGDELHIIESYSSVNQSDYSVSYSEYSMIKKYIERYENPLSYKVERIRRINNDSIVHDTIIEEINYPRLNKEPMELVSLDNYNYEFMNVGVNNDNIIVKRENSFWFESSGNCYNSIHEDGCVTLNEYYLGLGGPYYFCDQIFYSSSRELVYYKKETEEWGDSLIITNKTLPIKQPNVKIYPNPARDYIYIELDDNKEYEIKIFDISGKQVNAAVVNNGNEKINLSAYNPGVYFIQISFDNSLIRKKIILTKP